VRYAGSYNLHPAMTPSATPLLTREAIFELKRAGLSRLAVSLDGSHSGLHDAFRGVEGSYSRTLQAIHWANEAGVPIQVNTTLSHRNLHDLDNMAALLKEFKLVLWSLFFLVPTGRGQTEGLPTAEEFEQTFAKLYKFAQEMPYKIKTTEAQHYRRFILQQRSKRKNTPVSNLISGSEKSIPGVLPINDGKGFVFVSHIGEVFPSGFLPISAGSVRKQSLTDIYRHSELLVSLRDTRNLKGKCHECEFKEICGGSRARAYALSGDMFAEDECCSYVPRAIAEARARKMAVNPLQAT
jgi:AdoMet-dependent heme synthase